jgi:hypothetical protein
MLEKYNAYLAVKDKPITTEPMNAYKVVLLKEIFACDMAYISKGNVISQERASVRDDGREKEIADI